MPDENRPQPNLAANTPPQDVASPASHLKKELEEMEALFGAQPRMVQHFLQAQANQLAQAAVDKPPQARFSLPDQVVIASSKGDRKSAPIPPGQREQLVGGLMDRLTRIDTRLAIRQRLTELEQSTSEAVAAGAQLIRHATARHMVHSMLPSGRSVEYEAPGGDSIPSIPAADSLEPVSAITQASDAIVEEGQADSGRGELQVPFVPAALRFYLPQWVAFDEQDRLLVGSIAEAEAHVASMQRYVAVLHAAVGLAPYMVADDDYQAKRYGMLGQLVNQGRALARYETREIIRTIKRRAEANDLNRGLSLSLPYFDDQGLEMRARDFEVVPTGRVMFVPAFVARAAREESAKVAQDTRLDPATRRHLVEELELLDQAFSVPDSRHRGGGRA
ncbi:MAG: hypothetical protein NTU91_13120 [Chloroflexi bacterium]|jgi:hypothetical protein|nr:hypothetical protein [Chloroflexota bacterium]